jgi:hypothetical protein
MEFKKQSPMLSSRSHHGSCYLNGYIYTFGGAGYGKAERFKGDRWQELPRMKKERKHISLTTRAHKVYITDERDDSIEVFDTSRLVFELLPYYGMKLSSKMILNQNDRLLMFEHTYVYSKKGAALFTT